jgi:AcrR family transcriptional regulator
MSIRRRMVVPLVRDRMFEYDRAMAKAMKTSGDRRLRRADWERAALVAIAEQGLTGVAVEPLARTLGVTKGSFYAHFATRDELIEAALASWEHSHGVEGLRPFVSIEDPQERLDAILTSAVEFSRSGAPSVHISLLGELHDPRIRAAVSRVTTSRLELLTRSYRELGLPAGRAAHRARLAYATYLGLMQMAREMPGAQLTRREAGSFMREVRSALIANGLPAR